MSVTELQKIMDEPFELQDPFDYSVQAYRIFTKQMEITKATLSENSQRIEDIVLNRIMKADPLIPVASGRSKILSADLLKKIATNLGITVEEPDFALNVKKYNNPVPVVISTRGSTEDPRKIAEHFCEHGIKPIAVTGNLDSPIAKCAGEENIIPLKVFTEGSGSSLLDKLFGSTKTTTIEEIKKYCPLGSLGEFSSKLTSMYIGGILSSKIHDLDDSHAKYADMMMEEIYYNILRFYPHFSRRRDLYNVICEKIAASDFFGSAGEEYSSNIVKSFSLRVKQLSPKRTVHIFNSEESNPIRSAEFPRKYKEAVIFVNSGRGSGYASDLLRGIKDLREMNGLKGKTTIHTIGMTFTPNSYVHLKSDYPVILPNSYLSLSLYGSTILRTYEPISHITTDSMIPNIAIHSGIDPDKINDLMEKNHNILGY